MKNFLTREMILNCKDQCIEEVKVPEWGGYVYVRSISGIEKERIEELYRQEKEEGKKVIHPRAMFLVMTICDKNGQLIFTHNDIEELSKKSVIPLDRLFLKAQSLNSLSKNDLEQMEKNFKIGQTEE